MDTNTPAAIKHVKVSGGKNGLFYFTFAFTKKCNCEREPRIKIAYKLDVDSPESTAGDIKKKGIDALKKHKRAGRVDGLDLCGLDLDSANEWLDSTSPWQVLMLSTQLQLAKDSIASKDRSLAQIKQHKEKRSKQTTVEWTRGELFNKNKLSKAKVAVLSLLESKSEKNATVATAILNSIATELGKSSAFHYENLIPENKTKETKTIQEMMARASDAITHMRKRVDTDTTRILTAISALFVPNEKKKKALPCKLLNLNFRSKYVERGLENRAMLDLTKSLDGDIAVGELVYCRDGYGTLSDKNETTGSVKVTLHPFNTLISYKSEKYAQLARWYPSILTNSRAERSDKTPQQFIDTIEAYLRMRNDESPNKKDTIKKRDPKFPKQFEERQRIYRYESWNELWAGFQSYSPGVAAQIENKTDPTECPTLLMKHAPWEMVKGKDASCLCINCEGMNCVKRGASTAAAIVKKLLDSVVDNNNSISEEMDVDNNSTDPQSTSDVDSEDEDQVPGDDEEGDDLDGHQNTGPIGQAHIESLQALHELTEHVRSQDQIRLDSNAARKLDSILSLLQMNSKYDMCCHTLPCLESSKLEDAKFSCVNGDCPTCGIDKLWSKCVKASLFKYEYDATQGKWMGKINDNSPLKSDLWKKEIDWREYCYKTKPILANHAQQVSRQTETDDEDYSPTESTTARNLVLETRRGTLVDFLDALEQKLSKQTEHRNLVSSEFRSKTDYNRNSRPHSVARDQDFSENGNIEDHDKVQSQHWNTRQYTLFNAIVSWLLSDQWNKTTGKLTPADEVTVNGEFAGEDIRMDSFWAIVKEDLGNDKYLVEDSEGQQTVQKREDLRFRSRYSVAFGHISDDKKHDRWAMQHFTNHELPYLEEFMREKFPSDIPKGYITHLHQHSDNATSHFKSVGSMEYFTSLTRDRPGSSFVYSFGAPGHGKGPFDGLGGTFKNLIHRLIRSTKTGKNGVFGVEKGYIVDVVDVFDALVGHYSKKPKELAEGDMKKSRGKNPINHYKFFLYTEEKRHKDDKGPVPRTDETFHPLEKITKNYQFQVTNVGNVCMRKRSCFCLACLSALTQGSKTWQDGHRIQGCISCAEETTDIYDFMKRSCTKLTGRDVEIQRQQSAQNKKELAENLSPGDWVVFDSETHDLDQPFWLGRVMPNKDWDGKCTWTNSTRGTRKFGNIEVARNEVAMNILWYDRRGEGNTYHLPTDSDRPVVQCNSYLIKSGIKPAMLFGRNNRIQMPRQARERANEILGDYERPQANLHDSEKVWYTREVNNVYEMSEADYADAFSKLGLWVR